MSLTSLQLTGQSLERLSNFCSHLDSEIEGMSSPSPSESESESVSAAAEHGASQCEGSEASLRDSLSRPSPSVRVSEDRIFRHYDVDMKKKVGIVLSYDAAVALRYLRFISGNVCTQREIVCNLIMDAAVARGFTRKGGAQ